MLLVVPPGDADISTVNVHDSHTTIIMTDTNTNLKASTDRGSKIADRTGSPPPGAVGMGARKASNVGQIVVFAKEEKRRKATVTYCTVAILTAVFWPYQ
ncbi:hypothetical protein BV898_12707 [Hypsibius exemplaris]|uniref:Uncharacterized protein n=1 Tax=Hypsibius exemplaris TaxID=2072580 RepID=A0A1W0WCY9_HYPEX|nr:hypothetical protein BV898_12707 [Hypsibius exemplaris]